ncbi:uncharacterized protein LOC133922781 [Phragmites australis]|uniref:uncharacterized protein LOC133922781 n=1 Tax=Phragmites australis TaxID=29695 RepID=UPI002D7657B8|nr:uncharacterized protein LOC133922781 [Phragmites australis]
MALGELCGSGKQATHPSMAMTMPQPGPPAPLVDYLESDTFAPPPPPPPPPAPSTILSAWSRLRDSSSSPAAALETLHLHRRALRLSAAHVSLLLPLLPVHPRLVAPLLAASPHLLPASLPAALPLSPLLLLLGARASARSAKDLPNNASLGSSTAKNLGSGESGNSHDDEPVVAVSRILEDMEQGDQSIDDLDHLALAGIGYVLASADEVQFRRILVSLFRICGRIGNLAVGVRVLKLVEWLVMGLVESRKMRKVQVLFEIVSPEKCEGEGYVLFPVVMAACGGLRALRVASARYRLDFDPRLKEAPERTIQFAAERAVLEGRRADDQRILVQCLAMGLTRCGQVAFHESVLQCVCMGLLKELLPLPDMLRMSVESAEGNSAEVVKAQVNQHLDSVLFKEAGPVTGVFCNQYSYAIEKAKTFVETCVWEYAQELYCHLRAAVLLHRGKQDDLLMGFDKIAEAAFLMVVVFAAEVTKHRLNANSLEGFQPEVAARILVAFSCVEHLRRLRLPEYTEAVRRAVLANQENAAAIALFIESMPSYTELTSKPDLPTLAGTRYIWHRDDVETSRMLFYLRVVPTCVGLIPAHMIRDKVASIMFLYLQHSNEKVTSASHSVMVSFLSSGNDPDQDDRTALKEQLTFYYMKRSLEAYPGVTPFEGLASGVAALVRHLPAGSPAILFCIHSLVVKAKDLCDTAKVQDKSLWRSWEESTEPCKKILDLLLRLIFLVDIQSFPYLLKEVAEFVTLLPKEGQGALLDDMYARVAESDDVTRKPVLVSWLQSLSYISSQSSCEKSHSKVTGASSVGSDELSLNRTMARL